MNLLTRKPDKLDGQLKDRPVYVIPADSLKTASTSLYDFVTHSNHHRLHDVQGKRASIQLILTNVSRDPVIAFTGQIGYGDQPHQDIESLTDIDPTYIPDWNPLSAFCHDHSDKQIDGFLLCDKDPKAPIGPLSKSNHPTNTPSRTILDELIELISTSPYGHMIVLTIRAKVNDEYVREQPQSAKIVDQWIANVINWVLDKSDMKLTQSDRVYHVQPVELIAYSEQQSRPSKPLIDKLTDLSTSDHECVYERVRTDLSADKIAYASTDIKRNLAKRLFYRTDGTKRTLDLLEQDMDNVLQRRKHPVSHVHSNRTSRR